MHWKIMVLLATTLFSTMNILFVIAIKRGIDVPIILFAIGLGWLFFMPLIGGNHFHFLFTIPNLLLIILIVALSTGGNLLLYSAYQTLPNVGMASAITASGIIILSVGSYLIWKEPLFVSTWIGILMCFGGVILINLQR